MQTIDAAGLAAAVTDAGELALLDVREVVDFGVGHPLLATNVPLSGLELEIGALVPRLATRVVVMDGGGGEALLAERRLTALGFRDVAVLADGAPAWQRAGMTLFPEIEVPPKGFGAFARRHGRPRFIEAADLDRRLRAGANCIVLDARPRAEYLRGNIPGSIDAPGADVLRCFDDLVPDPTTEVVVNCMSATRGILGGLSLMAAGVPNPVRVLHHGTRGWQLEGLALESGASRFAQAPSPAARVAARARAIALADRAGLRRLDTAGLQRWRDAPDRTTYLFDVRTPGEFAGGHLDGAVNVPEGALVMSPGEHIATLNARVVLVDDDGVRAAVTGLWLAQMGLCEVAVLDPGAVGVRPMPRSPGPPAIAAGSDRAPDRIAAYECQALVAERRAWVIDVGRSADYLDRHVPGAAWCSRVRLADALRRERGSDPVILTSPDGRLAELAARDLMIAGDGAEHGLSQRTVRVLDGGTAVWQAGGGIVAVGADRLLSPRLDHWLASSERPGDQRANVVAYLDWEHDLLDAIEQAGQVPYRNLIW